jgi:hypothetical protein
MSFPRLVFLFFLASSFKKFKKKKGRREGARAPTVLRSKSSYRPEEQTQDIGVECVETTADQVELMA